jgi:hypothetical protein
MKKFNKNSRRYFVNLFADFILTRIDDTEKSIIQVTDCNHFLVVNGKTTSNKQLDLDKIKTDFISFFGDGLSELGIERLNTIDIVQYDQEVTTPDQSVLKLNKDVFIDDDNTSYDLTVSSEFPYGFSLDCGRSRVYYSNYIFNHIYSLLGVDEVDFRFSTVINDNDDFDIRILSETKQDNRRIESLLLDVFSFDLDDFKTKIKGYDITQDILFPTKEKPYLIQDKLEHLILF